MPIKKAAKKHLKQSKKRHQRNLAAKSEIKENIKDFQKLLVGKKTKEAQTQLKKCYKLLDKAAKRGIIKKNTASRKKSRFAKALNKISKSK